MAALVAAGSLPRSKIAFPLTRWWARSTTALASMRRLAPGLARVTDFHCFGRILYDPVLRWPQDPANPVEEGLAERWEWNEDGTELTLYFREGLKWSDGERHRERRDLLVGEHRERHQYHHGCPHEWKTLEELVPGQRHHPDLKSRNRMVWPKPSPGFPWQSVAAGLRALRLLCPAPLPGAVSIRLQQRSHLRAVRGKGQRLQS
jgi:hypothetical protein